MKYASTFLMGLSLSLLSMGCGDATTEQSINPDGPDPSQFSGAQTGPYDESNPGGAAAAPAEFREAPVPVDVPDGRRIERVLVGFFEDVPGVGRR